jgi:uncharacterized membrane protein YczE
LCNHTIAIKLFFSYTGLTNYRGRGLFMTLSKQLTLFFIGLSLFSYGISVAIQVQYLGIHPWDVLNIALSENFGLTIGTWNIICGLVLISLSFFLDRSYIKIGTFLNALLVGVMVDIFLLIDLFPRSFNLVTDILVLVLGIFIMGAGGGMYAAARLGAGPRDGFMLSISDKLGMSISKVRIVVESSVLLIGLLLGGPVFIFTFVYTFIQSPIFQYSFLFCSKLLKKSHHSSNQQNVKA